MSRFHQHLREDLNDPEFASAFHDMTAEIALLQVPEQARKALNVSEKERMAHNFPRNRQKNS